MQEPQPDQIVALDSATRHAFTFYPGNSLGYAGAPQSVMWKRDAWKLTWHSSISIPFTGGWRPQPIVKLQQRATGAQVYWINVHFSARRANQADRNKAMKILLTAIHQAEEDELPILLTGDFNEIAPAFCSITGKTAAAWRPPAAATPAGRACCRQGRPDRLDLRLAGHLLRCADGRLRAGAPDHRPPRAVCPVRDRVVSGARSTRRRHRARDVIGPGQARREREAHPGAHDACVRCGSTTRACTSASRSPAPSTSSWTTTGSGPTPPTSAARCAPMPWPKRLRRLLEGTADVRDRRAVTTCCSRAPWCSAAARAGRSFVDPHGIPIFVDKWGLIQRPFSGRREAGVVDALVDATREVLTVMREECGIEGWISFGTLLGAARDGGVIGHDSDIDLCFLSERETPAEMTAELWAIGRALRAAGISVAHRSASFLTVRIKAPDGGQRRPRHLHLLLRRATCCTRPRRSGRGCRARRSCRWSSCPSRGTCCPRRPTPTRCSRSPTAPDWRVPDPSFRHLPGPEITERFDGWFGSLMKWRRDWTALQHPARRGGRRPVRLRPVGRAPAGGRRAG